MKNGHKEKMGTEERILLAAREVFLKKGLEGARMQEIADKAEINKALLHYYFRKKENLFHEIIKRAVKDFFPNVIFIWGQNIPFERKVYEFVDKYITFIMDNTDLPRFFINLLYQNPELLISIIELKDMVKMVNLQEILDNEAESGTIKNVDAYHFIITVLSLCIFPAISNPLLRATLTLTEDEYMKLIEERKQIVPEIVLKWLEFDNKNNN
jgi:AcrR family transcriptional regulator